MKRAALSIIIFLLAFSARLYAQVTDTSGILWKATLTYFLQTDMDEYGDSLNDQDLRFLPKLYRQSHFNIKNEKGDLLAALQYIYNNMKACYDGTASENWPGYYPIWNAKSDKEIRDMTLYIDSLDDNIVIVSSVLNGVIMNEEYVYNKDKHTISIRVPDILLHWKSFQNHLPGPIEGMDGVIKFSNRVTDSTNTQQVLDTSIVWAEDIYTYIRDSSNIDKLPLSIKSDSVDMDGTKDKCQAGSPDVLKSMHGYRLEDWICKDVKSGKLNAYRYEKTGKPGAKLSLKEINDLTLDTDTVGEGGKYQALKRPVYLGGLMVVKEVSFDKKTFSFTSKIVRVAVTKRNVNAPYYKWLPDYIPLFWVKFE